MYNSNVMSGSPHFRRSYEMVESDSAKGWIDWGRAHLATVPARLTPKNVMRQLKWKLSEEGQLYNKVKWRLTSDDSIAAHDSDSRNSTTEADALLNPNLPSVLDFLAESVAIVKSQSTAMGLRLRDRSGPVGDRLVRRIPHASRSPPRALATGVCVGRRHPAGLEGPIRVSSPCSTLPKNLFHRADSGQGEDRGVRRTTPLYRGESVMARRAGGSLRNRKELLNSEHIH